MSVSQGMRFAVLERDGFTCQYCGKKAPEAYLEIDHIKATSMGGKDEIDNLIAACVECNRGKAGHLVVDPTTNEDLKQRLTETKARVKLLTAISTAQDEIVRLKEESAWKIIKVWKKARGEGANKDGTLSASWDIWTCVSALLARCTFEEVLDCVNIALARTRETNEAQAIRYLYGVVKNRRALLEDGEDKQ